MSFLMTGASAFANNPPGPPTGLMVELLTSPEKTVIYDKKPEFSWVFNDPDKNEVQKFYKIQVRKLEKEEGGGSDVVWKDGSDVVWKSGKINSAQSAAVSYGGGELEDGESYIWRVKTWDRNGRKGKWSDPQEFTVAEADDDGPRFNYWKGKTEGRNSGSPYIDYRYPRHKTPHYTPVTEEIKPNFVEKIGPGAYFVDFGKAAFGRLSLTIPTEDLSSDDSFKVKFGELRMDNKLRVDMSPPNPQIVKFETTVNIASLPIYALDDPNHYAFNVGRNKVIKIQPKIQHGGFSNNGDKYRLAGRMADAAGRFGAHTIPFRYAEIKGSPVNITTGNIKLDAVHYPFDDGASYFESSNDVLNKVWDLSKYTMKATSWLGVYVDGHRERRPYEGDSYIQQLGHYSVDKDAYSIARRSHEFFMDDPTWPYEWHAHSVLMAYADWMWTGDTESISVYAKDLYLRTQTMLRDAIPSYYPLIKTKNIPGKEKDAYLNAINYNNYKGSHPVEPVIDWSPDTERDGYDEKDISAVPNAVHHGAMVRFLDMMENVPEDVLGNYAKEQSHDGGTKVKCTNKVFRSDPIRGVGKDCYYKDENEGVWNHCAIEGGTCSLPDGQDEYQVKYGTPDLTALSSAIRQHKEKFNAKLLNKPEDGYRDGVGTDHRALHSTAFAVAFGLSSPEQEEEMTPFLLRKGMKASPYGAQYFLEALYKIGQGQKALNLLTSTQKRSWYNMLRMGSTITAEAWDFDFKDNMDLNHAWGAAPANIIPQHLMGVQPLAPGFSKMQIKPQTGNLTWAKLKMPTVKGPVHVEIAKDLESTFYKMIIDIPANTKADVYVPRLGIRGDSEVKPTVMVDEEPDYEGTLEVTLEGTHEDGGQFIRFSDVGSGKHVFDLSIGVEGNKRPGPGNNFKVSDRNTGNNPEEMGYVWCAEKFCVPPGGEGIHGYEVISCLGSGRGTCVTHANESGGRLRTDGFIKDGWAYRRLFYRPASASPDVSSGLGQDWIFCVEEDGYCVLPGGPEKKYCVRYGARGYYKEDCVRSGGAGIDCRNSEFDDPIRGTKKNCYYRKKQPGDWTFCVEEGGHCVLPDTNEKYSVRYGAYGHYKIKSNISAGADIDCKNSEFDDDPIRGTKKSCYYQMMDMD